MAINTNPGSPLKQIATYNSSGTFVASQNTNVVFVSIHSASGGSGGSGHGRYATGHSGGSGGAGKVGGAFVFVNPGGSHTVTIGAGGAAGNGTPASNSAGGIGAAGGTTIFDNALTATGGSGGPGGNSSNSGSAGAVASDLTGRTTLTSLPPSGGIARTSTITSQQTGGTAGATPPTPNRYVPESAGRVGTAGIVHIYG